jgi:hypothetical protein
MIFLSERPFTPSSSISNTRLEITIYSFSTYYSTSSSWIGGFSTIAFSLISTFSTYLTNGTLSSDKSSLFDEDKLLDFIF